MPIMAVCSQLLASQPPKAERALRLSLTCPRLAVCCLQKHGSLVPVYNPPSLLGFGITRQAGPGLEMWLAGTPEEIEHLVQFFCCERLSASMARSLHLSFICIPQSTRALDQGGVEPRQAVSPKALRPWTIEIEHLVQTLGR